MKKLLPIILLSFISCGVFAQKTTSKAKAPVKKTTVYPAKKKPTTSTAPKALVLKNNLDSACYALGLDVAKNLKSNGLKTLNYAVFNKGIKDAMQGANPALTEAQVRQAINQLFESFSKEREENNKKQHQPTIDAGNDFLAKNKVKPGIKTTASGLQYEILTEGTGAMPKATDKVTVHYRGTLLNGEEFDSSYKRNEPTSFSLNQVIPGWIEGVQLMKEGSKFRFFIPYHLAYGSRTAGAIPPYSTLIFEIDLIKVGGE